MTGILRLFFVLFLSLVLLIVLVPFQLLGLVLARFGMTWLAGWVPVCFHRVLLMLVGVRLQVNGNLSRHRPMLIVANHQSWLDIAVLGAVAPLSFVAKSEMAGWPLFGQLAKMQRTVFIRREERRTSGQQANDIANRMAAHEIMVLFPEGTTSDGCRLLPFKTPLFEAAKFALVSSDLEEAIIQPVAIQYTKLHGLPIGRAEKPHVAWPGEIGLVEHLIPLVRAGALDVVVHVGDPITLTQTSNRKIVARDAAASIRTMSARK